MQNDYPAATIDEVRNVKDSAWDLFSQYGTVSGVGITQYKDGFGLKINFETAPDAVLPSEVNGVPVAAVDVTGRITLA